jgi:hypothetical protein
MVARSGARCFSVGHWQRRRRRERNARGLQSDLLCIERRAVMRALDRAAYAKARDAQQHAEDDAPSHEQSPSRRFVALITSPA